MNEAILPNLNTEKFVKSARLFLQNILKKTKHTKLMLGVSGGIDSATVLSLCAKTVSPLNIHVALLPYGESQLIQTKPIVHFIKSRGVPVKNIHIITIDLPVNSLVQSNSDRLRMGNIAARVRMILLYDQAKKLQALVAGTENKSEQLLGYFTRFGDEASDVELIKPLYKTHVYQLANFLQVPQFIVSQPPTANLWEGQTDEKELGFTYEDADKILYLCIEKKWAIEKIISLGFSEKTTRLVINRYSQNTFKHLTPFIHHFTL